MPLLRFNNSSWVGFDAHFSGRVHELSCGPPCIALIDGLPSFLQRIFLGQVHRGEFPIAAMERSGSFWMYDQRVIALPEALLQLMNLQFDFHALVEFLNHFVLAFLPLRPRGGNCILSRRVKPASIPRAILAIRFHNSMPACGALAKEESVMPGFAQIAAEGTKQQQRQDDKFDRVAAP
jgi:hypothetical protein